MPVACAAGGASDDAPRRTAKWLSWALACAPCTAEGTLAKLQSTSAIAQQGADAHKRLAAEGFYSPLAYNEKQREAIELTQDLKAQGSTVQGLKATIAAQDKEIATLTSSYRTQLQTERTEVLGQLAKLEPDSRKLGFRSGPLELRAPQAGVVKDIATTTRGAVVQPGMALSERGWSAVNRQVSNAGQDSPALDPLRDHRSRTPTQRHAGDACRRRGAIPLLLSVAMLCSCEASRLDRQMEELCKKDGGVKIYETVIVSASEFSPEGRPFVKYLRTAKSPADQYGPAYRLVQEQQILVGKDANPEKGEGRLTRWHSAIYRVSDGRLLGESVFYGRAGGDGFTFGFKPSGNACPNPGVDLAQSVFLKGE